MVNYKKYILISICITIIINIIMVSAIYAYFFKYTYLNFEYIDSVKVSSQDLQKETFAWISLIDEDFEPFWDEEYLKNTYSIPEEYFSFFDKDEYTYVITFGRKLNLLYFRMSEARTKYLGVLPKQYIARVVLSEEADDYLYIYRTKKINIVNDYYGNGKDYVEYE